MSKKKFIGVQFIEVVREGKHTFSFGIYSDSKVGKIPFVGLASKSPEDTDNSVRGRNLAIGRAFENLGKQIEKSEWKKIKPHQPKVQVERTVYTEEEIAELRKAAKRDAKASSKPSKAASKTS